MEASPTEPEVKRFVPWLKSCDIPPSTGYQRAKELGINLIKIGRGSYIDRENRRRFISGEAA